MYGVPGKSTGSQEQDQGRRLRPKERKLYTDEDLDDDEIEGKRTFSVEEKLMSDRYNAEFIKELKGDEVTLKFFQENGFTIPLLVRDKTGLGMRVPSANFKVSDVKFCVGSRRMLDVMDVNTQKALEMSMKDWVNYYENPNRSRLLNVISLEFSHTRLENYVEQPLVVRQMDWVDTVWPRHLKDCQTEGTNILEKMRYPKVQKYCLMSVAGCYTDFHIDMGGTSVWYHILHGTKIFWLVPPTEPNLELYENWVKSGKQGDVFFGDAVQACQRIHLEPGITFFIPTGWIHAVFTPNDSLVFGGNFLHSFNIPMQLRVMEVEDRTHVPAKFRYPFAGELHWYLLERYISVLTGKHHRQKSEEEIKEEQEEKEEKPSHQMASSPPDTNDDRSNDSKDSDVCGRIRQLRRRSDDYSSQGEDSFAGSPMSEEQTSTTSPKPLHPKSPHSPVPSMSPKSPKRAGEENIAPRSHLLDRHCRSRGSRPGSPAVVSLKSDAPGARSANRNLRSQSDEEGDKKKSLTDLGKLKLYTQLEQIRPVSVKLENCMNMLDGAGVMLHRSWVYLTCWELEGLRVLVKKLEELPPTKRCVPKDVPDWITLLNDFKKLLDDHRGDDHKLAATGEVVLKWPPRKERRRRIVEYHPTQRKTTGTHKVPKPSSGGSGGGGGGGGGGGVSSSSSSTRRRRVRCKQCEACTRNDCGECTFCKDMKKYGGPGRLKQSCVCRQCLQPVLPHAAVCIICKKDDPEDPEAKANLMECGICWDILHPACLKESRPGLTTEGVLNEDLPNSWECPKCCDDGKQGQLKPRSLKMKGELNLKRSGSRQSSTSSDISGETKVKIDNDWEAFAKSVRVIVIRRPSTDNIVHIEEIDNDSIEEKPFSNCGIEEKPLSTTSIEETPLSTVSIEEKLLSIGSIEEKPLSNRNSEEKLLINSSSLEKTLSNANHAEEHLSAESLEEKTLSNANCAENPMSKGGLEETPLSNANIAEKPLSNTNLAEKPLSNTNLAEKPLSNTNLAEKPMSTTNLAEKSMSNANFTEESMSNANCAEKPLSNANFTEKSMSNANFTEESMSNANCAEKPLSNANFTEKSMSNANCAEKPKSNSDCTEKSISNANCTDKPKSNSKCAEKPVSTGRQGRPRKTFVSSEEGESSPRKKVKLNEDIRRRPKVLVRDTRSGRSQPKSNHHHKHNTSPLKTIPGAATRVTSRGRETDTARGPPKRSGSSTPVNPRSRSRSRSRSPQPGPSSDNPDHLEEGQGEKRKDPNLSKLPYPIKHLRISLQRYVVRPAPTPAPPKHVETATGNVHVLNRTVWMTIFRYLSHHDLCKCLRVCKTWNRWCMNRSLWSFINMSRRKVTKDILVGVVRRQPVKLDLSWTNISRRQLGWLASRLPQLRHLLLNGISWAAICALCSSSCPLLQSLSLDWANGIRDSCVADLTAPPTDHRPGVDSSLSRLHCLSDLSLVGNDITDFSLKCLVKYLPSLSKLNLSFCTNMTDAGIAILVASNNVKNNLQELELMGCHHLTDSSLHQLKQLKMLKRLCVVSCSSITTYGSASFLLHMRSRGFVMPEEGRFEICEGNIQP